MEREKAIDVCRNYLKLVGNIDNSPLPPAHLLAVSTQLRALVDASEALGLVEDVSGEARIVFAHMPPPAKRGRKAVEGLEDLLSTVMSGDLSAAQTIASGIISRRRKDEEADAAPVEEVVSV